MSNLWSSQIVIVCLLDCRTSARDAAPLKLTFVAASLINALLYIHTEAGDSATATHGDFRQGFSSLHSHLLFKSNLLWN